MSESKPSRGNGKAERPLPAPLAVRPKVAQQMLGGIVDSTFWAWVRNGEIEVVRIGHVTLIPLAGDRGLHAFLERHTVRAAPAEMPDTLAETAPTPESEASVTRPRRRQQRRQAEPEGDESDVAA